MEELKKEKNKLTTFPKEIKFHNDMNTVSLRNFNKHEVDLFISLCQRFKNQDTKTLILSFNEITKLMNLKERLTINNLSKLLVNVYQKLMKTTIHITTENKWVGFVLFTYFSVDKDKKETEIKVNEEFKWVLNGLTSNFTWFYLKEFLTFKSTYTKEFFRRMFQFRKTRYWQISVEDFRYQLGIPESYLTSDIDRQVFKPIKEELEQKYQLKVKKHYQQDGKIRRLSYYSFTFNIPEEKTVAELNEGNSFNFEQLYKNISAKTPFNVKFTEEVKKLIETNFTTYNLNFSEIEHCVYQSLMLTTDNAYVVDYQKLFFTFKSYREKIKLIPAKEEETKEVVLSEYEPIEMKKKL